MIPCIYSLAVRILRDFARQLGVVEGSAMESLLEQVTPENLHGETETGRPVGREEW